MTDAYTCHLPDSASPGRKISGVGPLVLPAPSGKQKEVVYLPENGHTVVLGSAGSGKTTMALLRATYVGTGQFDFGGKTGLVTYNRSLRNFMAKQVQEEEARPDVLTFHDWARIVLESSGDDMAGYLFDATVMTTLTSRAYAWVRRKSEDQPVFKRSPRFFFDELEWLDAMGITTLDEYIDTKRIGRSDTRLDKSGKRGVWSVRERYRTLRDGKGYAFDLRDIPTRVLKEEDIAAKTPYKHIVIDEGQDLTPQMLRAVAHAMPLGGSITFFGDPTQQIYIRHLSWKSSGLTVHKTWQFEHNYRNTQQITRLAREIGGATSNAELGKVPARKGPGPQLLGFGSPQSEQSKVASLAATSARNGASVAILARSHEYAKRAALLTGMKTAHLRRDLTDFETGEIYWGTIHAAKGFEFDHVLLIGLDDSQWTPDSDNDADDEAAMDHERKLLYVGVTRARTCLTLTHTGTVAQLLPTDPDLYG